MIGTFIGNYRVVAKIGEGGMGVVYLAEHPEIGRQLAVKVLHPRLVSDPQNRSRFLNEARAAAAIRHPNIVDVIDVGVLPTDGTPYIVMEHLVGEDLAARLHRRGTLPVPEAFDITQQTAAALGAAHARGIIHRDLKPANLFIVADEARPGHERVKVLDFGVAKLQGAIAGDVRTQSGVFLGTPTYMSPEQCLGNRDVDQRSDLYALGVILYEMLCGVPPFVSSGLGELVVMHTTQAPAAPRSHNAAIPESLEHVLARMLAKEPSQRFASAAELQTALAAVAVVAAVAGPRAGSPSWAPSPAASPGPPGSPASPGPTPPAPSAHGPSSQPSGEGAPSSGGSRGVTRAMHNSVIAALPVAERPAARRSRAGFWGFIAGASLAAVAAVVFVVTRSTTPAPLAAGDAAVADVHANDATIEDEHPGSGKHAVDAGRPVHPADAAPRPIDPRPRPADAGPPHPGDAAHPVDAAPPIDAAPPPVDAAPPPPPPANAAPPPADAAVHPADAGRPPDAGHPPTDASTPPVDAGRPPPDARPRPDAGVPPDAGSVPPKIAEACTRSCRKLRSCGLRPSASCEQSCTSSPKVSACALAAADDCNAAASCELVGQCNGEGPSGSATCNATFACELRCGSQAACACHCTQLLAPQHATAWLKLQRCVTTCRRDPACVQRSCSRFILACQAE